MALGVVLLLVFLVGRASGGGGGSTQEIDRLKASMASKDLEIDQLQRQVRAQATPTVPAGGTTGTTLPAAPSSPATGGGATTTRATTGTTVPHPSATTASGNEIYTVKPGESFLSISKTVYGTSALSSCIVKAQSPPIDPKALRAGQKITIPKPKPTAPC